VKQRASAILVVVALSRAAIAGPAEAKPHVDSGVRAYSAGDYATAIDELSLAYSLDPAPKVLFAWAQALRLAGRCPDALARYKQYLGTGPSELDGAAATTGIALCEQIVQQQQAELDRKAHEPPERPPAPQPWYRDTFGGVLVGGGVVGMSVGVTYLVLARHSLDASAQEPFRDRFIDLIDEATLRRRIGYTALGIGAALAVTGVVRYVWIRHTTATVAVAPQTAALVVYGEF
jgi:hypothetical protein